MKDKIQRTLSQRMLQLAKKLGLEVVETVPSGFNNYSPGYVSCSREDFDALIDLGYEVFVPTDNTNQQKISPPSAN